MSEELNEFGSEMLDGDTGSETNSGSKPSQATKQASNATAPEVIPAGPDNTVVLPADQLIDSLEFDGRDLVIILSDGSRIVVPDGAINVPQLIVDGTPIPAANVAALLVGSEPEPAAGETQSSGGNFATDPGEIQAAYDIGDLLPYTELPQPTNEEQEIIPDLVDEDPEIDIEVDDSGVSVINAEDVVNEAGLPERGSEPEGTDEPSNSEATFGFINFDSPDGTQTVTINGVAITAVGQSFTTDLGVLTITSIEDGRIGYDYLLTDNTLDPSSADFFSVTITDVDGDQATATLRIDIIDDGPIAADDTNIVPAGSHAPIGGNVLDNDIPGADDFDLDTVATASNQPNSGGVTAQAVTEVTSGSGSASPGEPLQGEYGVLTLNGNGTYTYVRDFNTPGGVSESFDYTVVDQDGSTSTATLTITVADAQDTVTVPEIGEGTSVDEGGLPPRGDQPPGTGEIADDDPENNSDTSETTGSTITFNSPDGVESVTIDGVAIDPDGLPQTVVSDDTGTLVVTGYTYDPVTGDGSITYEYTLGDNTSGDDTSVSFEVVVTDLDGDLAEDDLVIDIVDDEPAAADDSGDQTQEDQPVTIDVFANDTPGADGVDLANDVAAVEGTLTGSGTLEYNNDGTFTYAPADGEVGSVTFDYTIIDGDGDPARATVTINLADDSEPVIGTPTNLTVDEDGFGFANDDDNQSDPLEIDSTESLTDTSGTVTVDFGADVPSDLAGSIAFINASSLDGQLTAGGEPVTFTIDSNGDIVGATASLDPVITISLTGASLGANPGEVDYTYSVTLSEPIEQNLPGDDSEASVSLIGVEFQVTDGDDGDQDEGTFDVEIFDDVPGQSSETETASVDEDELADGITDNDAVTTVASGSLGALVDFGADQPGSFGFLAVADATLPELTSGGETVNYTLVGDTLYGHTGDGLPLDVDGNPTSGLVFTLEITDTETGAYTFTLLDQLDHVAGGAGATLTGAQNDDDQTLTLDFSGAIVATDEDGDQVELTGGFDIVVEDDIPAEEGETETASVDEDELADGITDNDAVTTVASGSLGALVDFGADQPGSFGFLAVADATLPELTSGGETVNYTLVGDTLYGHTGDGLPLDVDGNPTSGLVFTLEITDTETGAYTFTLLDQLDHVAGGAGATLTGAQNDDDQTLTLDFSGAIVATDEDGDQVELTGGFDIVVEDDIPAEAAFVEETVVVDEDGLSGANADETTDVDGDGTVLQVDPDEIASTNQNTVLAFVNVDFGADGPADVTAALDAWAFGDFTVLDGQLQYGDLDAQFDVTFALELDANGDPIPGSLLGTADTGDGIVNVIRIEIDNITLEPDGTYTYDFQVDLINPVFHPEGDQTEASTFLNGVPLIFTDGDNDTTEASFNIEIFDDVPSITAEIDPAGALISDENSGFNLPTLIATEDEVDGLLKVDGRTIGDDPDVGLNDGTDGAISRARVDITYDATAGVDGIIVSTDFEFGIPTSLPELSVTDGTANGAPIIWATNEDGTILYAYVDNPGGDFDGEVAFAISATLDTETGTGEIIFEQYLSLQHPDGSDPIEIALNSIDLSISVTDSDGDTASVQVSSDQFQLTVLDASPTIGEVENGLLGVANEVGLYQCVSTVELDYGPDGAPILGGITFDVDPIDGLIFDPPNLASEDGVLKAYIDFDGDGLITLADVPTDGSDNPIDVNLDGQITADDAIFFEMSIQDDGCVDVEIFQTRPVVEETNELDFESISPGNYDSIEILPGVIFDGNGSTINPSGNGFGIDNNLVNPDEGYIFRAENTTNFDFAVNFQPNTDTIQIGVVLYEYDANGVPVALNDGEPYIVTASRDGFGGDFVDSDDGALDGEAPVLLNVPDMIAALNAAYPGLNLDPSITSVDEMEFFFSFPEETGGNPAARIEDFVLTQETLLFPGDQDVSLDFTITDADGSSLTGDEPIVFTLLGDETSGGILGTEVGELITGTSEGDVIVGFGGDDTLQGLAGNDTLVGGAGNDIYEGDAGIDKYVTSSYDLNTDPGQDIITNYELGEIVDLTAIVSITGADDINDFVRYSDTDGAIQVDVDATGTDAGWVTVAQTQAPAVSPLTVAVLVDGTSTNLPVTPGTYAVPAGTAGDDVIFGFDTDDTLSGLGGNDTLIGQGGADTFVIDGSSLDTIVDYAAGELVDLSGFLTVPNGGDPIADGYVRYLALTNEIQVDIDGGGDGWVTVATVANAPASINVQYTEDGVGTVTTSVAQTAAPIVLDLDGGGNAFSSLSADIAYDYNSDGVKAKTAWIAAGSAILFYDANGDGMVTDASEFVFGNGEMTDLEAIAANYDSNQDGVLDANDEAYDQFGIWIDADLDAVSDDGEFVSLKSYGIESISLESDGIQSVEGDGDVIVFGTTSYTMVDGTTGEVSDAAFFTGGEVDMAMMEALLIQSGEEATRVTQDEPTLEAVLADVDAGNVVDNLIDQFVDYGGGAVDVVHSMSDADFAAFLNVDVGMSSFDQMQIAIQDPGDDSALASAVVS